MPVYRSRAGRLDAPKGGGSNTGGSIRPPGPRPPSIHQAPLPGTSLGTVLNLSGKLERYLALEPTEANKIKAAVDAFHAGRTQSVGGGFSADGNDLRDLLLSHPGHIIGTLPMSRRGGSFVKKLTGYLDPSHLTHKISSHVIQHMTPHEFGLVRGIAAGMVGIPHHMHSAIKKELGGSFPSMSGQSTEAIKDILRAPSVHHMADFMHDEGLEHAKGMDVGGGFLSGFKKIVSHGLKAGKKVSKGVFTVGRTFNKMLERGIKLAAALDPTLEQINPAWAAALRGGVATAKKLHKTSGLVSTVAERVHESLSGPEDVVEAIGADESAGPAETTAELGIAEAIVKAERVAEDE